MGGCFLPGHIIVVIVLVILIDPDHCLHLEFQLGLLARALLNLHVDTVVNIHNHRDQGGLFGLGLGLLLLERGVEDLDLLLLLEQNIILILTGLKHLLKLFLKLSQLILELLDLGFLGFKRLPHLSGPEG